ncbi:MAG TPA: ParB/RepB/Spo0J family partition protein [bacterium]|jgi:ParB/RepB/Spo0J family partition protein|nr:ParB/RepB/Spo0J family partition protein [bacterium]
MPKPPPINFSKMISGKPLQGEGPGAKPVPQNLILRADQLREADGQDRTESLKADWDEFLASIRDTAGTSQQGAGNHTPVIAEGAQAPYEIVAGRRRYLACRELELPIDAKVYPFLSDDDKARIKYSENFQRNNYTLFEIIENVKKETARGKDRDWLAAAFGKSKRSIEAYIAISKDARLTEEVRLGLGRREAARLLHEFGENAATEAAKLREAETAGPKQNATKKGPGSRKAKKTSNEALLLMKVLPGKRVELTFDEEKAAPGDLEAYGAWLDVERKRIGTLIGAVSRRKLAES